ncbi:hypothetical protein MMC19_003848 [Ptychographa xylographoides]|nr:hypothetical protein [Ptychographa xylographoides]
MSTALSIQTPLEDGKQHDDKVDPTLTEIVDATTATAPATIVPFPLSIPLPPHITIDRVTIATLPAFRRTISLLLPIRYPDIFYSAILSDPTTTSLSRAAIWHDYSRPSKRKRLDTLPSQPSDDSTSAHPEPTATETPDREEGYLVGAIRCRLEPIPVSPSAPTESHLYIQALALLSPYRSHGIATHLLEAVLTSALQLRSDVKSVYAHVWEANEEGLKWYRRKGFTVESVTEEGYYRRLKPQGAKVVRRTVRVADWLRANEQEDKDRA